MELVRNPRYLKNEYYGGPFFRKKAYLEPGHEGELLIENLDIPIENQT